MSGHDWEPDTFGDMVCRKCGILREPGRDREKCPKAFSHVWSNMPGETPRCLACGVRLTLVGVGPCRQDVATFENQDDECSRTRSLVEGLKFDTDKLDWWLVPQTFEQVVRVLMYGAEKYAPDNWRKVQDWRKRYYNAARRHLEDWRHGERLDPESGLPHLAHALCCVLFLLALDD